MASSEHLRRVMGILAGAPIGPGGQASIDQRAADLRAKLDEVGVERDASFAELWSVAGRVGCRLLVEAGASYEEAGSWLLAFWSVGLMAQEPG
jgi:hypothetical protein